MQNVAIYYRVSTDKQDLASQRGEVEKWLREQPEQPEKTIVFKDNGRSGKDTNRPAFKKMMREAARGKFNTLVVYALDRLSRKTNDAIMTLIELDQYNVDFISVTQQALNLQNCPFRKTLLTAFAEIAEIERDTLIKRTKAGLAAARARGVVLGRRVKGNPEQMAEVEKLRADGMPYEKIAKQVGLSVHKVYYYLNPQKA